METAPRVRVRTSRDRARDQIADLAVLNERLAGKGPMQAADVRKRLEYLKKRRRNWELVYQHVTRADALCTLGAIEEAAARVEALLSEESRERHSVSALKRQLVELQGEVSEAHQRLHLTQARVEQNLLRISELKEESSRLDEAVAAAGSSAQAPVLQDAGSSREALAALNAAAAASASSSSSAPADHAARTAPAAASAVAAMPPPVASTPAPSGAAGASSGGDEQLTPAHAARRGLRSSLEIEEGLRNHWFAAAFVSKLGKVRGWRRAARGEC
jgi:chlorophyllide a oxygenase